MIIDKESKRGYNRNMDISAATLNHLSTGLMALHKMDFSIAVRYLREFGRGIKIYAQA